MPASRHIRSSILVLSLFSVSFPAVAQVVTATLASSPNTFSAAVNPTTNMAYVANFVCASQVCPGAGAVTVINGTNNSTASVTVGVYPYALAVNSTTNKIYVTNACGNDINCDSLGTVTVIDGATNNTTTVTVGYDPFSLAVDSATNKIYVANACGNDPFCSSPGTVTVIDGNNNNSTSTVTVGIDPVAVAVNATTNFIYVANATCLHFPACPSAGTVTVINGANNSTQTVNVGVNPYYLAVNPVTNKIFVSNDCGNDINCASLGTVTAIDGATNGTTTVNVGFYPQAIVANPVTNKIYVANNCGSTCNAPGSATVLDGNNHYATSTVTVGHHPVYLDIDTAANKIYVANTCGNSSTCPSPGTLTVIDGATNSTFPVAVGDEPDALAVNSSTHTVYVPNFVDNTVSVVGGNTKLQLVNVTPCRLIDTRQTGGPITGGSARSFTLPQLGGCGIPTTAASYSLNVTVIPSGSLGYLTIWPSGQSLPIVSTMNSLDGRIKANAATVQAGVAGAVSVYVSSTTNVVLDVDGYFAPSSGSTLEFYSLTPCRVLDTRNADGPLGGPYLLGGHERDFPVLSSNCNIPSSAQAYSMNFTVVPKGGTLGFLTVWPQGSQRPGVSTLNNLTGTIVANAAIVPAGTSGGIATYVDESTQLVADIDGYFAPAGAGGLSLYPTAPCRVLDTRKGNGNFSGELTVDVVDSSCAPSSTAQAYVFNATVVPTATFGYLTLWPNGEGQPLVSTLDAIDGAITSNMAIVPTNNGQIDAYASGLTQLILDISSYYAP